MAAFFIAQYQVNDAGLYREYSAGAGPTLQQYGGVILPLYFAAETREGSPPGPPHIVVPLQSRQAAYNRGEPS